MISRCNGRNEEYPKVFLSVVERISTAGSDISLPVSLRSRKESRVRCVKIVSDAYHVTLTLTPTAPRPGNQGLTKESPFASDLIDSTVGDVVV